MKKIILIIINLFILLGCTEKLKKKDSNLIVHKRYFSVSENNKKIDSIENIPLSHDREQLRIIKDKRFNEVYHIGAIHFLIINEKQSYYLINYLEPQILMCGNVSPMTVKDSINTVNESISKLKKIKPIETREICKVLSNYKKQIYNDGRIPLEISFALKNYTLKGDTMYNIIEFMENNNMKSYSMRRMNNDELKISNN
jgi:hypothetical protein